jgi:hypothetical protein
VFLTLLHENMFHPNCFGCNLLAENRSLHDCSYGICLDSTENDISTVAEYFQRLLSEIDFDLLAMEFYQRCGIADGKYKQLFSPMKWRTRANFTSLINLLTDYHSMFYTLNDTYVNVVTQILWILQTPPELLNVEYRRVLLC